MRFQLKLHYFLFIKNALVKSKQRKKSIVCWIKRIGILLLIVIFCFIIKAYVDRSSDSKKIEDIRAFFTHTNTKDKFINWKESHTVNKDETEPHLYYAYQVRELYHKPNDPKKTNGNTLDSLCTSEAFEKAHPLNKFYTLYFKAFKSYNASDYETSIEYYKKANQYIYEETDTYSVENEKLLKLMKYISAFFIKEKSNLYVTIEEKLKKAIEENDSALVYTYGFNLAHFNNEKGDFHKTLDYAQLAKKYTSANYDVYLYSYIENMIVEAHLGLGQYDSIDKSRQFVDSLYKHQKLNDAHYNKFQILYLYSTYDKYPIPNHKEKVLEVKNRFQEDCEFRYQLSLLNDLLARIAQAENNEKELIEHLSRNYYLITRCGNLNQEYLEEATDICQKLISIYNDKNDISQNLLWHKNLQELQKVNEKNQRSYLKMMEFFTEREVDYAQKDLKFQKKNVENRNRVILFISVFSLIVLAGMFYIFKLYRGNKQYQRRVERKGRLLKIKNERISRQNYEMEFLLTQLQETNENLQHFAKVAAHDIKSPIATIHSAIEFLQHKYQNQIEQEDKEMFDFLQTSSLTLSQMINTLLSYSGNHQKVKVDQKVDLTLLIQKVLKKIKSTVNEKQAEINISPEVAIVKGNETLLMQLFQNLLQNALKFQNPNQKPIVRITFNQLPGNHIECVVEDNGIGIAEKDLPHIFKIFRRANSSENYEGSGIGLSTCKKIVESHGGKIRVESKLGQGTRFYVSLPQFENAFTGIV